MKVLDLRCTNHHHFEGWFASTEEFISQQQRGLVECPMCGDAGITRMPSAVRLNLSAAQPPAAAQPSSSSAAEAVVVRVPDAQAVLLEAVRQVIARTEDVGERFAEEARRIHYGEVPERGIRGQATSDEREALRDEGIEIMSLPLPAALKGTVQ
jgi:hypothetical protein